LKQEKVGKGVLIHKFLTKTELMTTKTIDGEEYYAKKCRLQREEKVTRTKLFI
jgi:hypothetical protein